MHIRTNYDIYTTNSIFNNINTKTKSYIHNTNNSITVTELHYHLTTRTDRQFSFWANAHTGEIMNWTTADLLDIIDYYDLGDNYAKRYICVYAV